MYLQLSKALRAFLRESDNPVAQCLWNINYYDCEYLPDGRIQFPDHHSKGTTLSQVNYLSFRSDGMMSYLPFGKEHRTNDDGTWKREGRQEGKAARVVRKLFTKEGLSRFKESDFDSFGNAFKAHFTNEFSMELIDNDRIADIYRRQAVEGDGTLNNSCMRGKSKEMFRLYGNCENVKILACWDAHKNLAGRALVWNCQMWVNPHEDEEPRWETITLMDRIYTYSDFLLEMFYDYAKTHNMYRKQKQSYEYKQELQKPDGGTTLSYLKVETDTGMDYFPYLDTFTYGHDGVLMNWIDKPGYSYASTDGDRRDDHEPDRTGMKRCASRSEWYPEEEIIALTEPGNNFGTEIHRDLTVEIGGIVYYIHSTKIVFYEDAYVLKSEMAQDQWSGNWFPKDQVVYCEVHARKYLKKECVETENGWVRKEDVKEEEGKKYYFRTTPSQIKKLAEQEKAEREFAALQKAEREAELERSARERWGRSANSSRQDAYEEAMRMRAAMMQPEYVVYGGSTYRGQPSILHGVWYDEATGIENEPASMNVTPEPDRNEAPVDPGPIQSMGIDFAYARALISALREGNTVNQSEPQINTTLPPNIRQRRNEILDDEFPF